MRVLALLAVLLPVALSADEVAFRLVFKDGSNVFLESAPLKKGNRLQGKLVQTGSLVSFRPEDVDLEKSAFAALPPAKKAKTPVPRKPTRAEAKEVFSGLSGSGRPDQVPERAEAGEKRQSSRPSPAPTPQNEVNEPNEGYWRERAGVLHQEQEAARDELAMSIEARDTWEREGWPLGSQSWALELSDRRQRVASAERRVADLDKKEEALKEEGRKAGALPGWLR